MQYSYAAYRLTREHALSDRDVVIIPHAVQTEMLAVKQFKSNRVEYNYAAVGNRLTRTDTTGGTTYEYDTNDRLVRITTGGTVTDFRGTQRCQGGHTKVSATVCKNRRFGSFLSSCLFELPLADGLLKLLMTSIGKIGGKAITKHQEGNHSTPAVLPGKIDNAVQSSVAPGSADFMEVGQLGGELFPPDKIPALVNYLERRGIWVFEGINGSFDGVRGVMRLPRNPTKLNVRHELSHMLDYKKYGDDYYKLFTPAQREQMVLERLQNNRIWDKLNDAEQTWSLNYPSTR